MIQHNLRINQAEINPSWNSDGKNGVVRGTNVHDPISDLFPAHFYNGSVENIVGFRRRGDEVYVVKYFATTTASVSIAKHLPIIDIKNILLTPEGDLAENEVMYDVIKKEVVTGNNFNAVLPVKKASYTLMFSTTKNTIHVFVGEGVVGLLATLNYLSLCYKKPEGIPYSLAAKKFLYLWLCGHLNYTYNEKLDLSGIEFTSIKCNIDDIKYPKKENLSELLKVSRSILALPSDELVTEDSDVKESLSGLIASGGVDEDILEISRHTTVLIEIDDNNFDYISEATIYKGAIEILYKINTTEAEKRDFLDSIGWGSKTGPVAYIQYSK